MTGISSFVAAIAVAAGAAYSAGSAFGADAPSWTGFYIGGNIGGGWGSRNADYAANDAASQLILVSPFNLGVPPASFTTSGALGGVQFGYNRQISRKWLVGVETDFNWSGLKGSGSSSAESIPFFGSSVQTGALDEHIKWFGTVRARLGYLPTNNLLAYITGGFAYARVERSGSYATDFPGTLAVGTIGGVSINCVGPGTCYAGSSSEISAGWTLGGGFEYAFSNKLSLKAEYLYVSLDGSALTESATNLALGQTPSTFSVNFNRASFNVARLGVNYRF